MIVLCVRRYLRFGLSFRDLEEVMAKWNLNVNHNAANPAGNVV
jgi:transposase-like protein